MKDGRRSNTWTAYLKPVRDRSTSAPGATSIP